MARTDEARSSGAGRRAASSLALAASLLATAPTSGRAAPERPDAVTGQWELSVENTTRKCRLALRIETLATGGRILALPYGCRKAFPILANVHGWALSADGRVEFLDSAGSVLLGFEGETDESLEAGGPQGEVYRLTSVTALARAEASVAEPVAKPLVQPEEIAAKPATPKVALRPADTAGRYAILREGGRDTGCMLTLDDKTPAKGGSKAFLAPACRDQGIVIFDPAAWRLLDGRLVLTARKGHTTRLELQPDGTWLKDPKEGKPLGLKKL